MIELDLDGLFGALCQQERVLLAVSKLAIEQGIDSVWCEDALVGVSRLRRQVQALRDSCGCVVRIG